MEEPVTNPPAPEPVTKDDIAQMLSEHTTKIEENIQTKMDALKQELTPQQQQQINDAEAYPWEKDPQWTQKTTMPEFMGWIEKYMEDKGFSRAKQEEITQQVISTLQDQQTKAKQEMQQAQEMIDKEVAEIRTEVEKSGKKFNDQEVFNFIGTWNKGHTTQIASFKEGYELFTSLNPKAAPPKAPAQPRIPGVPGADIQEDDDKDQMYFQNTGQAQAYILQQMMKEDVE